MGWLQRSLTARLVTCFLLLSLLLLGIVGYIAYNSGRQIIRNNVESHLESVAILKQQEIRNWVSHMEHTITWLASNPERQSDIAILVKHTAGDPEYLAAHESLVAEFRRIVTMGHFMPVFLLDGNSGKIITASNTTWEGKFRNNEPYFIRGKSSTYVSDIFHSLTMGQSTMVISSPVRDGNGKLLGVLAGQANLEPLSELMMERSGLGETGETFLVNKSNLLITNTVFAPDGAFKKWIFGEGAKWALEGKSGVGLFTDYREEPVIGAYRWLEDRELALIAKLDQAEAFAPIDTLRNTITIVGALALVFAAGFGLFLARWLTRPLGRLADYTRKVGKGEYDAPLEVTGRDEVSSVASDVKTMVGQLLQTQAELTLILKTTSDAMMSIGTDFTIIKTNAAMASLSGVDPETSAGKKCFDVFGGELCHTNECLLSKVLETKAPTTVEVVREGQDGTRLICAVTANPLIDKQGVVLGILEDFTDITERMQMQEKLLASERLATLGQFSGNISHELRNPLGVIDSSVYYLKTKLKDADSKVLEHLERVKSSVSSATAIIESLLNLTRMKEPQLERLNLAAITADTTATAKVPAAVNIVQDFPEQGVPVDADGAQLRMAFKNIIKNAVEAMDNEGTLTVTAHTTADGKAEVSFADTGTGITVENLESVFQPLFSTKARGIGFGLSIVRMIIDKHGGTVEAKSEPGKGATIIIRLPSPAGESKGV